MRRLLLSALLPAAAVLLLAACGGQSSAEFEESPSASGGRGIAFAKLDYEAALKRAKSERKLVMVDVYTDWCGWCRKLDKDVFADERIAEAAKGLVAVRIDAEKEGEPVARRFQVEGFPTILFVDGDGKLVKRIDGYLGRSEMLDVLRGLPRG